MEGMIPEGYCQCGCGEKTPIAKCSRELQLGIKRGESMRFIRGHNLKTRKTTPYYTREDGYVQIRTPGHPGGNSSKYVFEHTLVAEKVLMKQLPKGAILHHVDGDRGNNKNDNLVICESHAYHVLLHQRKRAYDACGNANFVRCQYCKQYDDPVNNMYLRPGTRQGRHRECHSRYEVNRKLKKQGGKL